MKLFRWILLLFGLLVMAALPGRAHADEDCGNPYTIVRGDRLSKLAPRCGTTLGFLLLVNPQIKNPDRIYPGQKIIIPPPAEVKPLDSNQHQAHIALVDHPRVAPDQRWIDIDISEQTLRAYQGRELVGAFLVSTGTWRTPTVTGQFEIYIKFRQDDMKGPGYYFEDVPYTMYFHKGYGIHGTYWHDNFGSPMSHGCVNMSIDDAAWLFDFASEGTLVMVHE